MKPLDLNIIKNLAVGAFVAVTAVGSMSSYIKETGIEEFELLRNNSQTAIEAKAASDAADNTDDAFFVGEYAFGSSAAEGSAAREGLSRAEPGSAGDALDKSACETFKTDPEDGIAASSPGSSPPKVPASDADTEPYNAPDRPGLIDLNSADSKTLQNLSGIGPVKARAIIEYRKAYGGFVCAEEILQVKGIGKATYEKIKDRIYVKTRDRQN